MHILIFYKKKSIVKFRANDELKFRVGSAKNIQFLQNLFRLVSIYPSLKIFKTNSFFKFNNYFFYLFRIKGSVY